MVSSKSALCGAVLLLSSLACGADTGEDSYKCGAGTVASGDACVVQQSTRCETFCRGTRSGEASCRDKEDGVYGDCLSDCGSLSQVVDAVCLECLLSNGDSFAGLGTIGGTPYCSTDYNILAMQSSECAAFCQ